MAIQRHWPLWSRSYWYRVGAGDAAGVVEMLDMVDMGGGNPPLREPDCHSVIRESLKGRLPGFRDSLNVRPLVGSR